LARVRVVLLGDSHLARVRRDLDRIGTDVVNAAVGGACTRDLLPQARSAGVTGDDVLVVSIGSNDAAPWKAVPLEEAVGLVEAFLSSVPRAGLVLVTSPGVDEEVLTGANDRTNAVLASYAAALADRFTAAGAVVVDGALLLAPLGSAAFADDGLHLTGAAYDLLLPALAAAIVESRALGRR
jgi:lysophospholipase L1-like esterase